MKKEENGVNALLFLHGFHIYRFCTCKFYAYWLTFVTTKCSVGFKFKGKESITC